MVAPNSPSARAQAEHQPGEQPGPRQRQRDPAERRPPARAEGGRDHVVLPVGGAQRALDAEHEERQRHEGVGDHHGGGREREGDPEGLVAAARRRGRGGRTRTAARRRRRPAAAPAARSPAPAPATGRGSRPGPAPRPAATPSTADHGERRPARSPARAAARRGPPGRSAGRGSPPTGCARAGPPSAAPRNTRGDRGRHQQARRCPAERRSAVGVTASRSPRPRAPAGPGVPVTRSTHSWASSGFFGVRSAPRSGRC